MTILDQAEGAAPKKEDFQVSVASISHVRVS